MARAVRISSSSRNGGFTLLELLLSLTILALITVMVLGAMRLGIRAWEKGEAHIDGWQRYRIVLDLMKRQLASISSQDYVLGEETTLGFEGDAQNLTLVSERALDPDNTFGRVFVKYTVAADHEDGEALSFFERNLVLLDKDFNPDQMDPDEFHALLTNVAQIRFEYLRGDDEEEPEWQEKWNPEEEEGFPLAVRIVFLESENALPVHVMARLTVEKQR